MALKVKDIMKLKSWRGIEVIAGAGGLDRYVVSVGICDYEFIRGIDAEYRNAFEKDMVIFSSLLFAKDDHTQIMDMLKFFDKIQIACLVEKATILPELPKEALEYADAHDLPIFRMANDTYMDTVMLDIMDAVRSDDNNNFSEDIIDRIISNSLSKAQLYSICKNVSLNLKEYVMCVYIKSRSESFTMSIDGCLKKYI